MAQPAVIVAIIASATSIAQLVFGLFASRRSARRDKKDKQKEDAIAADVTGKHEVEKTDIETRRDMFQAQLASYHETLKTTFARIATLEQDKERVHTEAAKLREEDNKAWERRVAEMRQQLEGEHSGCHVQIAELQGLVSRMQVAVLEATARAEVAEWRNHALQADHTRIRAELEALRRRE